MSILKDCPLTTKIVLGMNKKIADNKNAGMEKSANENESRESEQNIVAGDLDLENGRQKGATGNISVDFTTFGEKNEFTLKDFVPKIDFKG